MTRISTQRISPTRLDASVTSSPAAPVTTLPAAKPDRFETTSGTALAPVAAVTTTGTSPLLLQGASLGTGAAQVRIDLDAIANRLQVSLRALPDVAEGPLCRALQVSAARIGAALDSASITVAEALQQTRNLSDMLDALLAVERGSFSASAVTESVEPGTRAYDVTTTSADTIRIMVRTEGGAAGQARLKMYNLRDDGKALTPAERMMVRFDLEGSERTDVTTDARLDVQFGLAPTPGMELLDKRIHGIMLGPDGQPLLNRGGRTIADHHFGEDLPDALDDPGGFKRFTDEFLAALVAGSA